MTAEAGCGPLVGGRAARNIPHANRLLQSLSELLVLLLLLPLCNNSLVKAVLKAHLPELGGRLWRLVLVPMPGYLCAKA